MKTKERYLLKDSNGDFFVWTMKQILEELNRDRSDGWNAYNNSDNIGQAMLDWTEYQIIGLVGDSGMVIPLYY